MHLSLGLVAASAALFAVLLFGGILLLQGAVHSWPLPSCWRCGGERAVRRSVSKRLADRIAWWFFLVPYRCRKCQSRFYAFRKNRHARRPLAQARRAASA